MAKDSRVEQWLDKAKVVWRHVNNIPLEKVDWEKSLKNNARIGNALYDDQVDTLALLIADGVSLPDPVGYYNQASKIIIISGNHRYAGYRRANSEKLAVIKAIDWYIVECSEWKVDELTRTANVMESTIAPSEDDRLMQAIHLYQKNRLSQEEAAKKLHVSVDKLAKALRVKDVDERLSDLKFKFKISDDVATKIYRIKQDKALEDIARLSASARLTADEVMIVAQDLVKAAASEKKQAEIMKKAWEDNADRINKILRGQPYHQEAPLLELRKAVNVINKIKPETLVSLDKDLVRRCKTAYSRLEGIINHV